MPLRLYNTLTKRVEDFVTRDPGHVSFYTCGPTVYDDAHIGNFRSFLAADLLRRFIESPLCELRNSAGTAEVPKAPRRVTHVMNITDVGHMTDDAEGGEAGEDRMAVAGRRLLEAKKAGTLPAGVEVNPGDPYQIARFYEQRFKEDARRLGLKVAIEAEKDPTLMPRATQSVPGMIEVIGRLIAKGNAYVVGEAGRRVVYFDVRSFPAYGRLSGNTLDALKAGEGGRVSAANQAGKRHPADFLLWKEDNSHIMKWDSPWGAGYPGWHIECTVMGLRARGEGGVGLVVPGSGPVIDLHSGGEDNIFPHHECEIAQSCCAFNTEPGGASYASMWFHPRFLLVEGAKMSKSKGNFFTARDLFAKGIEPAALRLELIKTHYRSNANFTMQGLEDSQRQARLLVQRALDLITLVPLADPAQLASTVHEVNERAKEFADALADDLNVSWAMVHLQGALLDVWHTLSAIPAPGPFDGYSNTSEIGKAMSGMVHKPDLGPQAREVLSVFNKMYSVLGVLDCHEPRVTSEIGSYIGVFGTPEIEALLQARRDARAAKNFKASDAIRDELAAMGYAIKDMTGGKVEVRRA